MESQKSRLEAVVLQEGLQCLGEGGVPYTLRGEIHTRRTREGNKHVFYHRRDQPLPHSCDVAAQLDMRDDDELVMVNGLSVSHWDHGLLVKCLSKLRLTDQQELIFTVGRLRVEPLAEGGETTRYVLIELTLQFEILYDRGISEIGAKVVGVILKISERIAPVDIVNIRFKEEQIVLVKHAALTDHYLRVDSAKEITLTCVDTRDLESFCFRKLLFFGTDETRGEEIVFMCALQSKSTGSFLCAQLHTDEITLTDTDDTLDTDIKDLTKPDPRLFRLMTTEEGLVLRSILYNDYYLYFDVVSGLRLKRSVPGPQDGANLSSNARNFMFDFYNPPKPQGY